MRNLNFMWRSRIGIHKALGLAVALAVVSAGCGQLTTHYPPASTKDTKLEVYVNNLTIPGAPKNTAYNGGDAEIIAHLQGMGNLVAFYIPMDWGTIWAYGYGVDATTGAITYSYSCYDTASTVAFEFTPCYAADGWVYQRVDFQGHAKVLFLVGGRSGYYDVLSRPAQLAGNGAMTVKLEYEVRTRVLFSRDTWAIYQ